MICTYRRRGRRQKTTVRLSRARFFIRSILAVRAREIRLLYSTRLARTNVYVMRMRYAANGGGRANATADEFREYDFHALENRSDKTFGRAGRDAPACSRCATVTARARTRHVTH